MPTYERNPKHKSWLQPFDLDATQCPAWSHARAQHLLDESLASPEDGRRFATESGMAFAARITRDDIWYGYPVPWSEVPEAVRESFVVEGKVSRRLAVLEHLKNLDRIASDAYYRIKAEDGSL